MSRLEEEAKPILLPLLEAQSLFLSAQPQLTLARWIALKVMVAEFYWPEHVVVTAEQRSRFMSHGTIPTNMNIKIACCGEGDMRVFLSVQSSAAGQPAGSDKRTLQATTIGFGHLLSHVVVSTLGGFDPDQLAPFVVPVRQLWPPDESAIVWPLQRITAEQASIVAQRLAGIANLPLVDWLGTQSDRT